jgi:maltodextrin utilization protein YvdJ
MHNDKNLAVLWAKEHWHVALFACLCLPFVGAVLVDLDVVTVRGAVAATVAAIAYVLMTTWNFTHDRDDDNKHKAG